MFDENTEQDEKYEKYEIESNDTRETATAIALNKTITGNLNNSSDYDYYKIELPEDGKLSVYFANDTTYNSGNVWTIKVFKNLDEVTSFTMQLRDMSTESPNLYLAEGEYYIRVEGNNAILNNRDYNLEARFTASNGLFEAEPNNTAATATPISWLDTPVTGSLAANTDIDIYEFTVAKEGTYKLNFAHANLGSANSARGWKVELFTNVANDLGVSKATMNSTGLVPEVDSPTVSLTPGRYFVKVTRLDGTASNVYSDADYGLSVLSSDGKLAPSAVQNIQLEIVNYYDFAEDEDVTVKVVTYDEDGELLDQLNKVISADTKKVKLMIWGGDMDPLSEAYEWRY
jgi:hypothetical protein